jgi:GTP cyclohydrolase I
MQPKLTQSANPLTDFVVAPEFFEDPASPVHTAVKTILAEIGEDPQRQGLLKTPDRVARMYAELTAGYRADPVKLMNGALFDVDYDEMVIVKDIDFYSLCEHHMLPFFGRATSPTSPTARSSASARSRAS